LVDVTEYEKQLDRLYAKLPKTLSVKERFEVPEPQTLIFGNRTFIKNFKAISDSLNRSEQHLLRFLAKELATAGSLEGGQGVFQGKFNFTVIKQLIENYIKEYVTCPVCRSPDTRLVKEERFRFLICEACGAKSSVRG
jgi:translation initiation factor 2 subunit 2